MAGAAQHALEHTDIDLLIVNDQDFGVKDVGWTNHGIGPDSFVLIGGFSAHSSGTSSDVPGYVPDHAAFDISKLSVISIWSTFKSVLAWVCLEDFAEGLVVLPEGFKNRRIKILRLTAAITLRDGVHGLPMVECRLIRPLAAKRIIDVADIHDARH